MLHYEDRLYDGVFGYINLTAVEKQIIDTPIFQRLHHIKQLGMANIIWPNAVHTRFAHSLGVMHIIDRIITHIRKVEQYKINENQHQTLRLAALLHDIGHFPFSHVGEKATEQIASEKDDEDEIEKKSKGNTSKGIESRNSSKLHERLSREIVQKWNSICDILTANGFNPEEIGNIIVGASTVLNTMLLHSELDADRLDYLIRDSKTLGVSYGNIELDHIISTLGTKGEADKFILGVKEKGLRAVEHYVLARYFMYCQIIFYPKLYYLENLLLTVYKYMINKKIGGAIIPDEGTLYDIIISNNHHKFYDFNDHYLYCSMRKLHDDFEGKLLSTFDNSINENIKLLLSGRIPKPVLSRKILIDTTKYNNEVKKRVEEYRSELQEKVNKICDSLKLPEQSVFFDFGNVNISKMRSLYSPDKPPEYYEKEEAIKVIYDNGEDAFLVQDDSTTLRHLNQQQFWFCYVFVNPITIDKLNIKENLVSNAFNEISFNFFK